MPLLVEYRLLDKLKVINEGTGVNKKLKVKGVFQKCDEQNNNGRVYPRKVLESQVKAIQEKIQERSLVGALDHPPNDAIHLSQASHLITKLWVEPDGVVMGEAEILSTPNGKIVEALLNDGVKIGISSRGLGTISELKNSKVVNEDFKLITFDLVSDPSTKGAYPELTESVKLNSEKAQKILSKMKKEKILLTALDRKITEKISEARGSDDGYDAKRDAWAGRDRSPNFKPWKIPSKAPLKTDADLSHEKAQKKSHTPDKNLARKKRNAGMKNPKQKKFKFMDEMKEVLSNAIREASLNEGLVKKANKAFKKEFTNKLGKAVRADNYNLKGSSDSNTKMGRRVLKSPDSPTSKRAVSRARNNYVESTVLESVQRLEEGTGTSEDKKTIKKYLIDHLQDLWWNRPIKPYDPGEKPKDMDDEKLEFMKRILKVISDL